MQQVHLTSSEYASFITKQHLSNCYHTIVLDNSVAGIINYTINNNTIYYEDCFYNSFENAQLEIDSPLHTEVYLKMALVLKFYSYAKN